LKNAPANASKTITITISASVGDIEGWAAEYAGIDRNAPFDNESSHNSGTSQTNINDPTLTPNNDNSLLFAVCASGSITSANSPWTGVATSQLGNWAEYTVQGAKAAQAISFTHSAGVWLALEAAFKSSPRRERTADDESGWLSEMTQITEWWG